MSRSVIDSEEINVSSYRTIFLSDLHLGAKSAQADLLLDFLKHHDAETIYLVGDIVDGWQLKKGWHWPQAHNDVVQKILRKARKGARGEAGILGQGCHVTEVDGGKTPAPLAHTQHQKQRHPVVQA